MLNDLEALLLQQLNDAVLADQVQRADDDEVILILVQQPGYDGQPGAIAVSAPDRERVGAAAALVEAIVERGDGSAELKRMFVPEAARGRDATSARSGSAVPRFSTRQRPGGVLAWAEFLLARGRFAGGHPRGSVGYQTAL